MERSTVRTRLIGLAAVVMLSGSALVVAGQRRPDLSGSWQGTLHAGAQSFRVVFVIGRQGGGWQGKMFWIDQSPDPVAVSAVKLDGDVLGLTVEAMHGMYQGKLSASGVAIDGTWTQRMTQPLHLERATVQTAWPLDPSPHTVRFATVDHDVRLEVLDWGGTGRPLILLAGLGGTAHVFDKFAPKLTASYHVYGITRRGYGASSVPATGYSADRLGDDVLGVMEQLKITRPVLVGHSIAGEELSSLGSRYPEKVAGLVYLDAAYAYAFYDASRGDLGFDLRDLQRKLDGLTPEVVQELLTVDLPRFERDLRQRQKDQETMPAAFHAAQNAPPAASPVAAAIEAGTQKYTTLNVPVLAIFAAPHDLGPLEGSDPQARAIFEARDLLNTEAQAAAFEKAIPSARVVRLAHANHNVFISNESDVLREMTAFIGTLPK
jgi:non-heme chloroperoxidase